MKTPDDDVIHINSNNTPSASALQDVVSQFEKCVERSRDIDQLRSQLANTENEKQKRKPRQQGMH